MRSFAVIAGLAASVQAAAYGYPAYNVSSAVETPVYEATVPAYEVSSTAYPVYETTTVKTVDCPKPTTYSQGSYIVTVSSSTVLTYTETIKTTKTPEVAKPTTAYPTGEHPAPPAHTPVAPYPSSNGTLPSAVHPTASQPATKPSGTKPPTSEFTGAATQATVGFLAIVGAVAAFL